MKGVNYELSEDQILKLDQDTWSGRVEEEAVVLVDNGLGILASNYFLTLNLFTLK